jgi:hypothetical protein
MFVVEFGCNRTTRNECDSLFVPCQHFSFLSLSPLLHERLDFVSVTLFSICILGLVGECAICLRVHNTRTHRSTFSSSPFSPSPTFLFMLCHFFFFSSWPYSLSLSLPRSVRSQPLSVQPVVTIPSKPSPMNTSESSTIGWSRRNKASLANYSVFSSSLLLSNGMLLSLSFSFSFFFLHDLTTNA